MIFIGGISQGQKLLDYVRTVICGRCGGYGRYQVFMTYTYFSFFFIPIFKWNRRYFVKMTCCGAVYELDGQVGRSIAQGSRTEIRQEDLRLVQEGDGGLNREGSKPAKRCGGCGYETREDFDYCPKCGRRF